jgi:hypothetical protein
MTMILLLLLLRNRLPRLIKHYTPKGRRNQGKTTEETSGCLRPEQVNGPTPAHLHGHDGDDDDDKMWMNFFT